MYVSCWQPGRKWQVGHKIRCPCVVTIGGAPVWAEETVWVKFTCSCKLNRFDFSKMIFTGHVTVVRYLFSLISCFHSCCILLGLKCVYMFCSGRKQLRFRVPLFLYACASTCARTVYQIQSPACVVQLHAPAPAPALALGAQTRRTGGGALQLITSRAPSVLGFLQCRVGDAQRKGRASQGTLRVAVPLCPSAPERK